tara:strand:- start:469 stop:798 length:330 start_codon:yes stop_codon:yes gene_type:complete
LTAELLAPPIKVRPRIKGIHTVRLPKGSSATIEWCIEQAWAWHDADVILSQPTRLGHVRASDLEAMEQSAPTVAAIYRRELEETAAANERMKLTQTIARIQKLIVDQFG